MKQVLPLVHGCFNCVNVSVVACIVANNKHATMTSHDS